MSGAIPPLPNTPPWRGAQLKHRDNFTYIFTFYTYNDIVGQLFTVHYMYVILFTCVRYIIQCHNKQNFLSDFTGVCYPTTSKISVAASYPTSTGGSFPGGKVAEA
jgi:hypothetical protein